MKLFVRYIAVGLIAVTVGWFLLCMIYPWSWISSTPYMLKDEKKLQGISRRQLDPRIRRLSDEEIETFNITGNYLIDKYKENNGMMAGENGRGILLAGDEEMMGKEALLLYQINTVVSDYIPLNRKVPDSRPLPCRNQVFDESNLPTTAVVIPFYDEWPSVLLRTIYSIINRTPRQLLKEIILVDDASSLASLKEPLDKYINTHFPHNLIKMVRLNERSGLINARLRGFDMVTAEVVCFFDSHMEVNIDWLQPLLVEIKKNRTTLAMSQLDYIRAKSLLYYFDRDYKPRYGFDWKLVFFENYFRDEQMEGKAVTEAFQGVVMVGAGFAVDSEYFKEIGTYDKGMKIWGGENLELSWRVSMCGGQLVHALCSHIGHIARPQPYLFPEGRQETEIYNYKRAVDVWMGPYKKYVYNAYPAMKHINSGNLTDRLLLKKRLKCKSFDWYLDNIWPELFRFEVNVMASGQLLNTKYNVCLDNNDYVYQSAKKFTARECNSIFAKQGFALSTDGKLRSSLNCVGTQCEPDGCFAILIDCLDPSLDRWNHKTDGQLQSDKNFCLDLDEDYQVLASRCDPLKATQIWKIVAIPL